MSPLSVRIMSQASSNFFEVKFIVSWKEALNNCYMNK